MAGAGLSVPRSRSVDGSSDEAADMRTAALKRGDSKSKEWLGGSVGSDDIVVMNSRLVHL